MTAYSIIQGLKYLSKSFQLIQTLKNKLVAALFCELLKRGCVIGVPEVPRNKSIVL